MPVFNGIQYQDLTKDFQYPVINYRRDAATITRKYSVDWKEASEFAFNLRGNSYVNTSGAEGFFSRVLPDNFYFQDQSLFPFVCKDVYNITGQGMGDDTDETYGDVPDAGDPNIVFARKANMMADYEAVRYRLIEDDQTNTPLTGIVLPYNEWDRFTDWSIEWSVDILTAPQGSFKYVDITDHPQVNIGVQMQTISAVITAKVYDCPVIPPATFMFVGRVNDKDFSFYIGLSANKFTAAAETLLLMPPVSEPKFKANLGITYDMTYRFLYRPQTHNKFFRINKTTNLFELHRIAVNTSTPTADNSAPFWLRNMGYLWSPDTPAS